MKKREGSALAFTIIIMVVITILSGIILQIAMAETMQAKRDKDRVEAYYLARSGVEATTKWILNSNNDASKIIDKQSTPQDLGNGNFNVEVLSTANPDEIIVKGTGTVGKVSQESSLILKRQTLMNNLSFKHAIYATESLTIGGNTKVTPDGSSIASDDNIIVKGANLNATLLDPNRTPGYKSEEYLPLVPPVTPIKNNNFSGPSLTFSSSNRTLAFDKMTTTLGNKDSFTIYTGYDTSDGVANLIVNNLNLGDHNDANIIVDGKNRLNIYVINSAVIRANINSQGPSQNVFIALCGTSSMNMKNNITFNGFIYGPNADFDIHGNTIINGGIIIRKLDEMTGNVTVNKKDLDIDLGNTGSPNINKYEKEKWIQ